MVHQKHLSPQRITSQSAIIVALKRQEQKKFDGDSRHERVVSSGLSNTKLFSSR